MNAQSLEFFQYFASKLVPLILVLSLPTDVYNIFSSYYFVYEKYPKKIANLLLEAIFRVISASGIFASIFIFYVSSIFICLGKSSTDWRLVLLWKLQNQVLHVQLILFKSWCCSLFRERHPGTNNVQKQTTRNVPFLTFKNDMIVVCNPDLTISFFLLPRGIFIFVRWAARSDRSFHP